MEGDFTNSTFTILPMNQEFKLKPGETYTGSIQITNPNDATADFHYIAEITPYSVANDTYAVDLATISNRSEITKWIKISNPTGTVAPNGSQKIEFTITVPSDAPAGGQYATIAVRSNEETKSENGVAIKNIFEMASIIYASVDGKTTKEGQILSNEIPGFSLVIPFEVKSSFENKGNVHELASVFLTVKDFFTGQTIYPKDDENNGINEVIMPESTRELTREVSNVSPIGVYIVNQRISYLGNSSLETKTVIVCPIWFLALIFFMIVGIITMIIMKIKKRHSRKRFGV